MSDETKLIRRALVDILGYVGADEKFIERYRCNAALETIFMRYVNLINELQEDIAPTLNPNAKEWVRYQIIEILKERRRSLFEIHLDIKVDADRNMAATKLALENLIDDGKVEKVGDEYRLAGGG
jgi:hypothetical protein